MFVFHFQSNYTFLDLQRHKGAIIFNENLREQSA